MPDMLDVGDLIEIGLVGLMLGYILILWFETDFVHEYSELLRLYKLGNILYLGDFHTIRQSSVNQAGLDLSAGDQTYIQFLMEFRNSFLARLVNCPICVSFWLGLGAAIFFDFGIYLSLVLALIGLLVYRVFVKLS